MDHCKVITNEELDEIVRAGKVKHHHNALALGYVSRKGNGYAEEYSGKFGTGYVLHLPYKQSTKYHRIEYYIKPEN